MFDAMYLLDYASRRIDDKLITEMLKFALDNKTIVTTILVEIKILYGEVGVAKCIFCYIIFWSLIHLIEEYNLFNIKTEILRMRI
jgi:hypothetical protein